MEHFSEQRWVDFVRGVSGHEIGREIRTHIEKGCRKCDTALDGWNRVRRLATEETAYAPPENLVRLVKLGFASKPVKQPGKWSLANLVFDSFAHPLPAGVRSGTLHVWQVIYEAEGLAVDLRFGRRSNAKSVHLVGQVLDKQEARAGKNATVALSTEEDKVLATPVVNASGEFQLEFEAEDDLWLVVKVEGRNTIRLPLANTKQR